MEYASIIAVFKTLIRDQIFIISLLLLSVGGLIVCSFLVFLDNRVFIVWFAGFVDPIWVYFPSNAHTTHDARR